MAIKTDMSKAYDRVEWCFLEELLDRFGFARTWINWIMACVSTVSYSVLLNGRSHGFLRPERGIRQGDPLSPFLFILCVEALVSCLNHSEASEKLHGINISVSGPSVHHLLFADDSLLMCKATLEEATEISRCPKAYEEASGQFINKTKSSVIFGSKVPDSVKGEVKAALNIDKEGGEGSYLGLPECFSGSKVKLLDFIKEKLQGMLKGWFAKALSHGGKEILIKSVALALPVYAMSCFKLPKTVIANLTSALTEFWWSTGDNRRKIPWVAWQKLCKPKAEGGMRFHDIAQFNQALLGKQAWRIWNNPSSLIAQILKHRYFANSSFLDSVSGSRPSFAWRSILHGRELLKQGLLHSVGDGSSIRMWVDNWILDTIPRPPKYRQDAEVNLSLRVDHLIDPIQHQWDVTRVRQLIAAEDVELVLKTKININGEDSQLWCFSNNGNYSSRSGYQCMDIIRNSQSQPLSSIPPIERALWSKIWKVKTSPKIRHFLWRILSGALAVKDRLRSRCIPVDVTCPSCDAARETICHLLFTCRFACEVWQLSLIPLPPAGFSPSSVFLNLHYLVSQASNNKKSHQVLAAFPWILWYLWKSRNLLCFEQRRLSPKEVLEKACEDSVIWHDLHHKKGPPAHTLSASDTQLKHWTKPPHGVVKCNIGSSFVSTHHNSGVSWITRNHLGITVLHSRRSYSNLSSPLENDLMSFYWAIESMRNLRFTKVIFQASSAEVRSAFLLPSHFPEFRPLILKIMSLLYEFDEWSLEHTDDMGNQPAIAIATSVTRDQRYPSYISKNGPSWLQHLLLMESALD